MWLNARSKTSSFFQWYRVISKSIILENDFILVLSALVLWRQINVSERHFIRQGRCDTGLPSRAISEAETLTMALKSTPQNASSGIFPSTIEYPCYLKVK